MGVWNGSCHCGAVSLSLDERPEYVNECNCTLCSKSGARWAYFDPSVVHVEGETSGYRRADKAEPGAQIHFCRQCGATTHFTLTEATVARFGNTLMGVNTRLADEQDLAGVELRYPDGRAWPGEGEFSYVRPPERFGDGAESD